MSAGSEPDGVSPYGYEVVFAPDAFASANVLPKDGRAALDDVLQAVADRAPLLADPYDEHTGSAATPMQLLPFGSGGRGLVVFLVHDRARVVHVVSVTWL